MKTFSKIALISSLVISGLVAGNIANAKAKFYINICYIKPLVGHAQTMSGSTTGTVTNNGGVRSLNSKTAVWCDSMANHVAVDPNSGNYAGWPLGGQENMAFNIKSPTFYKISNTSTGTVKVGGTCNIPVNLTMSVFGFADGYTQFGPLIGSGATAGLLKIKVVWDSYGLRCTPVF